MSSHILYGQLKERLALNLQPVFFLLGILDTFGLMLKLTLVLHIFHTVDTGTEKKLIS